MTETTLIARAQAGDFDAFLELVREHQQSIYALAKRLTGSAEDAEDVLQETLLKAIDKIDTFRAESTFGTWLHAIALNEARRIYSSQQRTDPKPIEEYLPPRLSSGAPPNSGVALFDWGDPAAYVERVELADIIDAALIELAPPYREAFVLRYLEELPVKEVAALIGESEAATKSRILRARLAMRDHIATKLEVSYGKRQVS